MIRLLETLPRNLTVAVSGGVDSMVLFDFLRKNHNVSVAFVHHRTENSERAYQFVTDTICKQYKMPVSVYMIDKNKHKDVSWEEHWRNERYKFFDRFETVATAHTLDDVAETWMFSSINGTSSLMPYRRNNVIRPFLLTRKAELYNWAVRKDVPWIEDTSNNDLGYTRNYIRHQLMPHVLRVNPGIHTMLRKRLEERQKMEEQVLTSK
jgi:tRNA(Ile)-lysidine synthase